MEKQYEKAANAPSSIEVRGARVHNLKNIDVDIPLGTITGIAGVFRFGQVIFGARRPLCGRIGKVPGGAFHLYEETHDAGSKSRCG